MRRFVALLAVAGVLFSLSGTASAERTSQAVAAVQRLAQLGILQGDAESDLIDPFLREMSRGELVTLVIRATGREDEARKRRGEAAYPDTAEHWASGEIAVAKEMAETNGFVLGMPSGNFEPRRQVTPAQVLAFLEKLLGVPADPSRPWPDCALESATEAGMISAAGQEALRPVAEAAADHYLVFYLLDSAFFSYKLADGKTVYTKYVKPNPPRLDLEPADFLPGTGRLTIHGHVSQDAIELSVSENGKSVRITPDASGHFTYETTLSGEGGVTFMAMDLAGNRVSRTITISHEAETSASTSTP